MKAYIVYPGNDPDDFGCLLVFAESANKAKIIGRDFHNGFFADSDITTKEMSAYRRSDFDKYATTEPGYIETNDGLPDGVEFYVDD